MITASDEDGGSTIATFDLTVNNVAPTLTVDSAVGDDRRRSDGNQQRHLRRCTGRHGHARRFDWHRRLQRRRLDLVVQRHG